MPHEEWESDEELALIDAEAAGDTVEAAQLRAELHGEEPEADPIWTGEPTMTTSWYQREPTEMAPWYQTRFGSPTNPVHVVVVAEPNFVHMNVGRDPLSPTTQLGMTPKEARALADALNTQADEAERGR